MTRLLLCIFVIWNTCLLAYDPTPAKIKMLYSSLDPKSVTQHLAFHHLYPWTPEGKSALRDTWKLLQENNTVVAIPFPEASLGEVLNGMISLVTKGIGETLPQLNESELDFIEKLGDTLSNRKLIGYTVKTENELLQLDPTEIDLGKAVLLNTSSDCQIRTYQALLDLMALQIRAKLPAIASPAEKIRAINDFIFVEMRFRFPPHSLYAKEVDLYTFLPSVLDGRQGVCLGVSVLYICLAQRLGLCLEAVTPPGHIYLRYRDANTEISIETTARGIHMDSEEYISIATKSLQIRNLKEVIGLTHFNHASTHLSKGNYSEALTAYLKAEKYLPKDPLLSELMAYQYLFLGEKEKAIPILDAVKDYVSEFEVYGDTMAQDFLSGRVDEEGIKTYFMPVDESRKSILEKQKAMLSVLEKYPNFRMGLASLAITWLQLHRHHEALEVLERYWKLDSNDPTIAYYLTMLYVDRLDFNKARAQFEELKKILANKNHHPKMIKDLERAFALIF